MYDIIEIPEKTNHATSLPEQNNVSDNVVINVGENVGIKLTDTELKVLDLLRKDNTLALSAIANKASVTERTISRTIQKLKENGVIERVGSNKSGYWQILK